MFYTSQTSQYVMNFILETLKLRINLKNVSRAYFTNKIPEHSGHIKYHRVSFGSSVMSVQILLTLNINFQLSTIRINIACILHTWLCGLLRQSREWVDILHIFSFWLRHGFVLQNRYLVAVKVLIIKTRKV